MGLHSWLRHEYEISNIDVELKHRRQDRLDRQSCRRQCEHCLETTNRFMWEVQLVTDALKGKGQYTRNPDDENATQAQPGRRVLRLHRFRTACRQTQRAATREQTKRYP